LDISIIPMVFIDDISNSALQLLPEFIKVLENYEKSVKSSEFMSVDDQKFLDRLSCEMVTLMTSLLLTLRKIFDDV